MPPTTLIALLAITGLFGMVIYSAKKNRFLAYGILWFLTNLVIESSVIGLEIIFEHRTYLPSMFFIPVLVVLCFRYIRSKWVVMGLLCLLIAIEAFWTYQRNEIWQDGARLWADCVQKSPLKARPHYNLGIAYYQIKEKALAIHHFNEALKISPNLQPPEFIEK